ncbi:MAG: sugar transferase [Nitrospira sp.]|nr:sugar transferase [Nitrospira sp.]MBS0176526.1 sugar transferase [Nitrospira sp.]MBX3338086.1 sugar transferase [Nitrospira sp.]MCW5780440.1 sugar transferase [Nitrospira sp.]
MISSCVERTMPGTAHTILDELSFKASIRQERQRTERSGQAMVMLLISAEDSGHVTSRTAYDAITGALSAVKSDIDILGWYERQSIMGLLVPDVAAANMATICNRLEAGFQKEFTRQLEGELAPRLSISLHAYPEPWKLERAEHQEMDPSFFPELQDQWAIADFHAVKRGMDIVLSLLLLIVLSPLLGVIAGLVKLSSRGPVIFRQVRVGQMMKPFMMCKFRTMYANADHGVHHSYVSWFITSSDKKDHEAKDKFFKLTNDPRITPIGHLLRRTSLDELPQLWNVLIGEMSLVGPRPPLLYELERYKPWHRRRVLDAKPGITGLWQVVGRSRTTFDEMVRLDLRYARTMSFWGDIKILVATPAAMISGKGAC